MPNASLAWTIKASYCPRMEAPDTTQKYNWNIKIAAQNQQALGLNTSLKPEMLTTTPSS